MAKVKKEEPVITVNGTKYPVSGLSDEARRQVVNIQGAEAEIKRLQMLLALAQTARNAYQQALVTALPEQCIKS